MKRANVYEAKTNLSKLIELVLKGKEVVIYRAGSPVDKLVLFRLYTKQRVVGALKGEIVIEKDFEELSADFMEYFN